MPRYIFSEPADSDLDEIIDYIATEDITSAISFNERLIEIFELLSTNPKIGRKRNELSLGARSFPEGNYLIIYKISKNNDIVILRILHGARDIDELF